MDKKGKEVFIIHPNKLENIVAIKPFKIEKYIFDFEKLEFRYQSGKDYNSQDEVILRRIELALDKVRGNYPIQFYMDD